MIVIGALQQTPEERLDADDLEVLAAHFVSPDRPRDAVGFQAEILNVPSADRGKYGIAIAHIAHFRLGKKRIRQLGEPERHHPVSA